MIPLQQIPRIEGLEILHLKLTELKSRNKLNQEEIAKKGKEKKRQNNPNNDNTLLKKYLCH